MRKVDPVRHDERRREILDAAARCFGRSGFRGASIAHICAEAGMSAGHLYHYFPSKEAIVAAMVDANLQRAGHLFGEIAEGKSVTDSLIAEVERHEPTNSHEASLLFDMFAEAGRSPTMAKLLGDHSRGMRALLVDLLKQGQERGEVDPSLDPNMIAPVLMGLVDGAKALDLRDPQTTPHAYTDVLRTLIARFLSPPAKS